MVNSETSPIVVVGDCLLDVDTIGEATRLCPDAPVPVLDAVTDELRPGGAALAATLAARDGRPVVLVTPLRADDDRAARLRELLDPAIELIALPYTGTLPTKRRLRAAGQTLLRLDSGGARGRITDIPASARDSISSARTVLVADYGGATTSDSQIRTLLVRYAARGALTWDPHPRGAEPVPLARLVTPNAQEAAGFAPGIAGDGLKAIRQRAEYLLAQWRAQAVAVTVGAQGAVLSTGSGTVTTFPVSAVSGGDTCGAGDCFAAAAACAFAAGALPSEAVAKAVAEAAAFVGSGGAAGLRFRMASSAALNYAGTPPGEPTGARVATGGCFDLLHAGHIATLETARAMGDSLTVCLNGDASVRRLKGAGRPLQPAAERARVLAALRCVDEVVIFDEDTPVDVLRSIRPDIWVKGGDYDGGRLPETSVLAEWGGEVVTVPYVPGCSTTGLIGQARR